MDVSGRVIATWGCDALRRAIVDTVLEAGQTTVRDLPTITESQSDIATKHPILLYSLTLISRCNHHDKHRPENSIGEC